MANKYEATGGLYAVCAKSYIKRMLTKALRAATKNLAQGSLVDVKVKEQEQAYGIALHFTFGFTGTLEGAQAALNRFLKVCNNVNCQVDYGNVSEFIQNQPQ